MALSIGMFASGWPAFITAHAWIVWVTAAIGMALFAAGLIVPTKGQSDGRVQSVGSANVVGRDNNGRMIANVEHYYEAPSTVIGESSQSTHIDIPIPAPVEVRLELSFERASLVYKLENAAWDRATEFDHDRRDAIIAWFTNPVPPRNIAGVDASDLSAHIKYSAPGHWTTQVARAYWLHRSANRIRIDVADRAGLILGLVDWSYWVAYENHHSRPIGEAATVLEEIWPLGQKKEMPKSEMEIDVSILAHGTTTIEQIKLLLTFSNDAPFVARLL